MTPPEQTREQRIEAFATSWPPFSPHHAAGYRAALRALFDAAVAEAVAKEREACARTCEDYAHLLQHDSSRIGSAMEADRCRMADRIRARAAAQRSEGDARG